jgi:hypothetical protein
MKASAHADRGHRRWKDGSVGSSNTTLSSSSRRCAPCAAARSANERETSSRCAVVSPIDTRSQLWPIGDPSNTVAGFANFEEDFSDQGMRDSGPLPNGVHVADRGRAEGVRRLLHPYRCVEGLRHARRQPDHRPAELRRLRDCRPGHRGVGTLGRLDVVRGVPAPAAPELPALSTAR